MNIPLNSSYADEKTGSASAKEENGDAENNGMSTQTEEDNDNTEAVSVEMKMMNNSSSAEGAAICCMAPKEDYEASSRNLVTNATIRSD